MSKIAALPAGQIIRGDFCGQYLYRWDNTTWGICPGAKLENSFLAGKLWWHNEDYSASGNWFGPTSEDLISDNTVDHFVEIGEETSGPDASAMLKGTLIGGVGLGMIAGAASASSTVDVAIHLKNGKNFVVRFTNPKNWLELKSMLYSLEQPQREKNVESQTVSIPSPDKFEAIKKYKELLDMGIISQAEFDNKKEELLGSFSKNAIDKTERNNTNQTSVAKRTGEELTAVVDEILGQAKSVAKYSWGEKIPPAPSEYLFNLASLVGKELSCDEFPMLSFDGSFLSKVKLSEFESLPKPYHLWAYRFIVFTDKCRMWYCYGQLGKKNDIGQHLIGKLFENEKPIIVSSPQKKQTVITIKGQANNLSITCSEEAGRYLAESIKEIIKKWDGFSL